ncbi:MAG: hypothetical protein ACON5C_09640 [Alphaproteobacteria bacterium]
MKDFWKIAHKRACVIGFGLAVILGVNVGFDDHARAQAKGCVIKNPNGVMSVANPRPVGANEVEFEDSVMGTQRMLYWPKKTLFCQNGAKTTVDKLSGQCQLKPAKKKNGGNNVWKLLCSGDKAASNKAGQRVERGPLMKGNNQDNMAKPKGTGFVMGQGGKPVLGQCNENDPNAFTPGQPCRNCTIRFCDFTNISMVPNKNAIRKVDNPQTPKGTPPFIELYNATLSNVTDCEQKLLSIKSSGKGRPHVVVQASEYRFQDGRVSFLFSSCAKVN